MPTTWNAIYLGNFSTDLDPTEGSQTVEDEALLVGETFGSASDRLARHVIEVTAIDNAGSAGVLDKDNDITPDDQISFDLGSGPQTTNFDSVTRYDVTITYTDQTTASLPVSIFQDTDGNLFLASHTLSASDRAELEAKAIESLTVDAVAGSFWIGMPADQTSTNFVCYVAGTLILTPAGPRRIESLRPGDPVVTADRGAQPVRWLGRSRVAAMGKRRPVLIRTGALGQGLPRRDLRVSRQHRMLVASRIAGRMFGSGEVLVPAIRLVGLPGIELSDTGPAVTYCHLLLDRHEIVFAEGAPAESLLPGPLALDAMGNAARADLRRAMPALRLQDPAVDAVRPIPPIGQQRRLIARHAKNTRPLLSAVPDRMLRIC